MRPLNLILAVALGLLLVGCAEMGMTPGPDMDGGPALYDGEERDGAYG